uniref:PA2c domain-containing protein n=1 Tax=Steinernema glaseri TaxID=37863 RepID=A0A1I7ZVB7_9BILA
MLPSRLTLLFASFLCVISGSRYATKIRVFDGGLEVHETTDFSRLFVSERLDGELIDCWEVTDIEELSKRVPLFVASNGEVDSDVAVDQRAFADLAAKCKHQSRSPTNSRHKRAMSIFPGTNWCGSGHQAPDPHTTSSETDKCCRQHDSCPIFLGSGEFKYGTRNYLPYTISYCKCDYRFHGCLKNTSSVAADLLGRFYFNVAHNECFDLVYEETCKEWYLFGLGGCKSYGRTRVARFRELPRY